MSQNFPDTCLPTVVFEEASLTANTNVWQLNAKWANAIVSRFGLDEQIVHPKALDIHDKEIFISKTEVKGNSAGPQDIWKVYKQYFSNVLKDQFCIPQSFWS